MEERDVLRIPVSKDRLRAMPKDERALLILFGYAANQINTFQKFVIFSSNKDGNGEVEQILSGAQTQMFARVVIGVLNEALRLVQERFLRSRIGKEYVTRLDQKGTVSLDTLKKHIGSNLLTKLRTNYIFHHPYRPTSTRLSSARPPILPGIKNGTGIFQDRIITRSTTPVSSSCFTA
jgi:hypothetical protein